MLGDLTITGTLQTFADHVQGRAGLIGSTDECRLAGQTGSLGSGLGEH